MNNLNILVEDDVEFVIVGDVHEHSEQFTKALEKLGESKSRIFISVGDLYHKGFGTNKAEYMIDELIRLESENIGFMVKGNHEIKELKRSKNVSSQLKWASNRPLIYSFKYKNYETRLTIVHGGIGLYHNWENINSSIDLAYIRTLDNDGEKIPLQWVEINGNRSLKPTKEGIIWHKLYDGRFGYVASGHDSQKDGVAKFYKHSCNLDSAVYETGILSGIIFSKDGIKEKFTITGPTKAWHEEDAPPL